MFLLGATAIEDKLQDGVPDTIHTLQMAGIKVLWFYSPSNYFISGGLTRSDTIVRFGY